MPASSPVTPAPGELEIVRAFVNTLDIESGADLMRDPDTWAAWAGGHGLPSQATAADLRFGRGLREALRAALLANHDRAPLPTETIEALDAAATRSRLTVRFTSDGPTLRPVGTGADAVYGRIVSAVAASLADGTWSRLKVCAADDCRWGFYDTSRSRTGQWCSMSICGNRAKQARWRDRTGRT
ncbi:CGNR zinc finger domain-containing protein [Cellulomonas sp. zg-ZUI222]|uniref:CGNR zinc finger domain-containing protein n=1 Tax=Cellulomonas wangleii TaxID=2816956 RepID=UPI001A94CDA5|nr:CGNR zinc finger domain-containing protein [Cellulomonas wangleii]MBO0922024.1 CGNR zinc finger domain-containing protein [Cellulomonas wangleii]